MNSIRLSTVIMLAIVAGLAITANADADTMSNSVEQELTFIPPTDCMPTYQREIVAQRFNFYVDEETTEEDGSVTTVYVHDNGHIIITSSKDGKSCVIGVSK